MASAGGGGGVTDTVDVQALNFGVMFPGETPITSMDFHENGEHLVTASLDGSITLINSLDGKIKKKVFSKKYGVDLVRFTHHDQCILCTSRPPSEAASKDPNAYDIRYLCLYDNQFLRFFSGHTARITSLAMSPLNDRFLSASMDGTVRLWDLQHPKCLAMTNVTDKATRPVVAWDPTGVSFAVGASYEGRHTIKLFGHESFAEGPFIKAWVDRLKIATFFEKDTTKNVSPEVRHRAYQAQMTGLHFSSDGNTMLVTTTTNFIMILDAFDNDLGILATITDFDNSKGECSAAFTPDFLHVVVASEDHQVHVFDSKNGKLVHCLKGHPKPVTHVACNPKYEVVATACENTILWLPQQEDKKEE